MGAEPEPGNYCSQVGYSREEVDVAYQIWVIDTSIPMDGSSSRVRKVSVPRIEKQVHRSCTR